MRLILSIISFDLTKNGNSLMISTLKSQLKVIDLSNKDSISQIFITPYIFSSIKALNSGTSVLGLHKNKFYKFDLMRNKINAIISYHTCIVKCFCVSPDEKILACGYNNMQVVIFNYEKGCIITTMDRLDGLSSLSILKDSHYLIIASLKYIIILNLIKQSNITTISYHNFTIYSLLYIESKEVIAGGDKGRLCKFRQNIKDKFESDIHSKKVIRYLTTNYKEILITATKDEDIRIWDVKKKKLMKKIDFSPEVCNTVSLARSERFVVAGFMNFCSLFQVY